MSFSRISVLAIGLGLVLSACGGGTSEAPQSAPPAPPPVTASAPPPAAPVARPEPPAAYASLVNPLAGKPLDIEKAKALFEKNCASCHGLTGKGDGAAAAALKPKPANYSDPGFQASSDQYTFWRISEGGMMPPFNSAMVPWKDLLTKDEIWLLAGYVKTLK